MKKLRSSTRNLSIRHKLYLALFVINCLTLLVGYAAWNSFRSAGKTMNFVTEDVLPMAKAASEIAVISTRLNALAPRLSFVRTYEELEETYYSIGILLSEKRAAISKIQNSAHAHSTLLNAIKTIQTISIQMEDQIHDIQNAVTYQISLKETQKQRAHEIMDLHHDFMLSILPIVDDAYFELNLGLENSYNPGSSQQSLLQQAETMSWALEIKADGNLLAGIIEAALYLEEPEQLVPLKERFDATIAKLNDRFKHINNNTEAVKTLQNNVQKMISMGQEQDNVFSIQKKSLENQLFIKKNINVLGSTSTQLKHLIQDLETHINEDVNAVNHQTQKQINLGTYTIFFVSAVSIILTFLISWLFIRNQIMQRIASIKNVMVTLAEKNYEIPIEGRNIPDELGEMSKTLFVFREKLIENEFLTKDLKDAIAEAEEAKSEAIKASQIKSEFLANMSHELRTPLNSIIGLSRFLVEDIPSGENSEMAGTIHKSAISLLDIVNDILDLSKIEAGQVTLERIPFDFKDVVSGTLETLAPIASAKGLWMNYKYETDNMPYFIGDPLRLNRVLVNLASNAVKYTEDGCVELLVRYDPLETGKGMLYCSVKDTGIGIPPEKQDVIFHKFSQADETTTRKYGGTGLGLSITRELIEMMNGEIGVESEVDKGSLFWFKIPLEETDKDHKEEPPRTKDTPLLEIFPEGDQTPASKANVLVAEDHTLNQIFIKKLLGRLGFKNYDVVENGDLAVEAYKANNYDLVLMDCHMPETNGYQATKIIRTLEKEQNCDTPVPIIALTADAMVGTREKCINAGMDDYVSKPLDPEHFYAVLSQWFKGDSPSAENQEEAPKDDNILIDLSTLKEYAETKEERENFCNLFYEKTEQALDKLEDFCVDGENKDWVEITHQIKGSAGMFGAIKLQQLCAQAQGMATASRKDRLAIMARIKTTYDETISAVKKEI